MYLNGHNLRILEFRREVYVSYDSWETTFVTSILKSSVPVDGGKDIRDHGVQTILNMKANDMMHIQTPDGSSCPFLK